MHGIVAFPEAYPSLRTLCWFWTGKYYCIVPIIGAQGGWFNHLSGMGCHGINRIWGWKSPVGVSVVVYDREGFVCVCVFFLINASCWCFLYAGGWKAPIATTKGRICYDSIIQVFTCTLISQVSVEFKWAASMLALGKKGTLVAALEELSSKGLVEVSIVRKLGLYKGCGRFLAA